MMTAYCLMFVLLPPPGLVSPVKNQGQCGSCAAFATIAAMETCFKKLTRNKFLLSEQVTMDCGFGYEGANACNGAPLHSYAKWVADTKKVGRAESYPYKGARSTCPATSPNQNFKAIVSNALYTYSGTEDKLKNQVAEHSVVIVGAFFDQESLNAFYNYRSGVFNGCTQNTQRPFGHAMVAVGYGSEGGQDYWLIKNSWGTNWGEKGFLKLRRGVGACNIGKALTVINCAGSNVKGAAALDCEEGDEHCGEKNEEAEEE